MKQHLKGTSQAKAWVKAAGLPLFGLATLAQAAEITLPPVSVGAGLRSSFTSTDTDGAADDINDFTLNSARLYIGGAITEQIKFTLNTEIDGDNDVQVIDAIGRFEFSPKFNIWAGRFLPPSDRANLHGPYYGNAWGFAVDGIQDGFPFVAAGRNDGVAYWGDFDRLKVSVGVFDVPSTKAGGAKPSDTVFAARLHVSLWDIESGYYLNGTYYGDKDILSFGVATHNISGDTSVTFDALMEKKLTGGGVVSLEGEYASYEGAAGGYGIPDPFTESSGFFVLGAYLFPQQVGIGKFQVLGKFATNTYETAGPDIDRDTVEFNLNYVMKAFNARLSLFVIDTSFDGSAAADFTQIGLGLQLQI
jgi:hypothetical protein